LYITVREKGIFDIMNADYDAFGHAAREHAMKIIQTN
jgi:hypothetical protein